MSFVFLVIGTAMAQNKISGVVLSEEDGQPVIGAAVKVEGTNTGTVTDVDGNFSLSVAAGTTLRVSYVGMISQTVKAAHNMKVVLKSNTHNLDDVVVVAYGTAKKQSITGAVSVVGEDKIKDRIATSVTSALEGAAPGIQVNNSYGEPGANPSIRIRGVNTLVSGADQPLYVVDGAVYDGNISELNPSDIESMSVLKDASSAALYGNRAANGVVLITTKRGKGAGKPKISLNVNQGFYQRGIPEYDRMGADQWMETAWITMKNYAMSAGGLDEATAKQYATQNLMGDYVKYNIYDADGTKLFDENGKLIAKQLAGYDDLNWEDNVQRTGHRQDYTLAASMAGEKYNVYSSVGYLNEKGYVVGTGYERFTGRVNSQFTPVKWFKTGLNLNATYATQNFNESGSGTAQIFNPFYTLRYMAPVYPIYQHNADGSYALDANGEKQYNLDANTLGNRNLALELRTNRDRNRRAVVDGQVFGTFILPYGFEFTLRGTVNHSNSNRLNYNNPLVGDGAANNGRLRTYAYQYNSYTAQELLNWSRDFGAHHVDVLLGHENYSWQRDIETVMNTNMVTLGNLTLGNFLTNSSATGYNDIYKTESYLGRVRYNYDEKYYADFSYRRDGSSKFHPDNRWGDFFSFGLNWDAKKEAFLKDVNWLDQLRVRASYGEVGNDAGVSYYAYKSLYYIDKNGGNGALIFQSLPANSIKWETSQTVDLGFDAQLFKRLNVSFAYFDKRAKDLLFQVRLPLSAGSYPYSDPDAGDPVNLTQYQNVGTISNRGFEIGLSGDVVRTNDWTWTLNADATFIDSKIVKLPGHTDIMVGSYKRYSENHSPYEFYTYHFEGVDQMTGNSLYTLDPTQKETAEANGQLVTVNGKDYTTNTTYGLRDFHGSAMPTVYGSFGTNLRWKSLSLSALFTYSLGGKTFDAPYYELMQTGSASSAAAMHVDLAKAWNGVPEGMTETSANRIDPNGVPVLDFSRNDLNNAISDRWLTSASYLVFKNITLTYDLPKTWMNTLGLGGVTLTAGAENLFTLTSRKGLNPQYNFTGDVAEGYVTARVFNFGVALKF